MLNLQPSESPFETIMTKFFTASNVDLSKFLQVTSIKLSWINKDLTLFQCAYGINETELSAETKQ